uniref:Probable sugar phosphate/phosphate translocator At3g14410 isoform X2 n=1 Tax=Nicotiana sylvestris TaxID=4096 RepID=A0A1U7Y7F3_NICSY|nr:PREDICTED: probable sugar phosphate/phosphate translocator At3g14410 isoform X2 [Nicotiana sylvestris]
MADPQRKWVSEDVVTCSYLLLYIALSSGQIFFNKWVLSSKDINFPYPLGLTLLHMVFSSILCFVLTKVLKIMKVEEGMTLDIYMSSVIPIGAMFAMTLWLGNTAYLYISVSFAQMLKAIMPVAVFILGVAAGLEVMSCRMLLIIWRSFEAYIYGDSGETEGPEAQPHICDVLCQPMQRSLFVNSMDLFGETKDGRTEDMELPSSYSNPKFSMYLCPESVCFSGDSTYKCPDNSCCWSCQRLGRCAAICPTFCGYKIDTD